jgi:hypothetical protein
MIEQQRAFMGHGLKDVSANAKRHSDSLDGFGRMACTGYLQQSPNVLIRQAVFKFACLKIDF